MDARVRVRRVFIVRAHVRARICAARTALPDLPRFFLPLFLSFGRYRYDAHKVGPGPVGTLPRGAFVTSHVARMFPFFRPAPFPFHPELREEDSLRGLSPFPFLLFLFTRRIKKGTRDLPRSAETLSSSATCPPS